MADVRRLRLTQSGGFAGLTRRYEVDAVSLDPAQRKRLEELLAALGHPSAAAAKGGQPDRFQFDLAVETAAGARQWRIAEADAGPAQKALIDWIKTQAKPV